MKKLLLLSALLISACGSPESIHETPAPSAHYGPMERPVDTAISEVAPNVVIPAPAENVEEVSK